MKAAGGGLDLLDDDSREAADRFAEQYRTMRMREGWADASGREDPEGGPPHLWKSRFKSVSQAADVLDREWGPDAKPVVADVGSGGGWAARLLLKRADVIAFDLLDVTAGAAALTVRADMLKLPLRPATVDAVLYAASLHYAPVGRAVAEAARVLRQGGLLVAVDSPIYPDPQSQARAMARTTTYYAHAGYPELAEHYQPIDVGELRSTLVDSGFEIEWLNVRRPVWRRLARRPPSSLVVARRLLR